MAKRVVITTKRDLVYRQVDGISLHLDAYYPRFGSGFPCALVVHGGAWRTGDEDTMKASATAFAQAGFTAFAVEYRKAPPGGHWHANAPVEDLLVAVAWIQNLADRYGGDRARLVGLGGSAGGHLIQMLAVRGAIQAGASWSGPSYLPGIADLLASDGSGVKVAENYVGCSLVACPQLWEEASPRPSVSPWTAPLYLANSDAEIIPLEQATSMAEALAAAGVDCQLRVVPGADHGSYRADIWDETLAFLRAHV